MKRKESKNGSSSKHRELEQRKKRRDDEEKKAKEAAVREVEEYYIQRVVNLILRNGDGLQPSDQENSSFALQQCESFRKYSQRIKNSVYQKAYNDVMERSSANSSYSFSRRTPGAALDDQQKVFMKDIDIDFITRQAVLQAFREQVSKEDEDPILPN